MRLICTSNNAMHSRHFLYRLHLYSLRKKT